MQCTFSSQCLVVLTSARRQRHNVTEHDAHEWVIDEPKPWTGIVTASELQNCRSLETAETGMVWTCGGEPEDREAGDRRVACHRGGRASKRASTVLTPTPDTCLVP